MSNIRKRPAMDESWIAFKGLNQIGKERSSQKQGHCTSGLQVIRSNRAPFNISGDDD